MTTAPAEKDERNELFLSVIICTHDPRADHLVRTLGGLAAQTLDRGSWELLVVDNASTNGVIEQLRSGPLSNVRVVREDRLGLTMARIRGISETHAPLVVFVDDDNVLAPDALAVMKDIARRLPAIGVIGAGRLEPEFESPPSDGLLAYTPMLALRSVAASKWSNDPMDGTIPWGAGMVIRREVADRYCKLILADPMKQRLDRAGNTLNSCGDDEFSWVACEMGLGKGLFTEITVTHLIDRSRVQREYLLRLAEGHAFSRAFLLHLHAVKVHRVLPAPSFQRFVRSLLRLRFSEAMHEGQRWANDRSRTELDRAFDEAKRQGNQRFFTTVHG